MTIKRVLTNTNYCIHNYHHFNSPGGDLPLLPLFPLFPLFLWLFLLDLVGIPPSVLLPSVFPQLLASLPPTPVTTAAGVSSTISALNSTSPCLSTARRGPSVVSCFITISSPKSIVGTTFSEEERAEVLWPRKAARLLRSQITNNNNTSHRQVRLDD